MPSERYYRLPEAKKATIRQAALGEFSRVPYDQTSINKIIREAGISRGCFYTYFSDKEDLLKEIFATIRENMSHMVFESLKVQKGDVWKACDDFYSYCIEFCKENNWADLFKNLNTNKNNQNFFMEFHPKTESRSERQSSIFGVKDLINTKNMNIHNDGDLAVFGKIILSVLMISLGEYYEHPDREEENMENYRKKMHLIRYGAEKRQVKGEI